MAEVPNHLGPGRMGGVYNRFDTGKIIAPGNRFHQVPAHALSSDGKADLPQALIILEGELIVLGAGHDIQAASGAKPMSRTLESRHEEALEKPLPDDSIRRLG